MGSAKTSHLPGLDGVRGLAIFLVFIGHATVMIPSNQNEELFVRFMSMGWVGVDLFFVLSGFLITGILLDTRDKKNYFSGFYTRRVLRIFPLYYALLIFSFYVLPNFNHAKMDHFSRVSSGDYWYYWLFLTNIKMAIAGGPQHGIMDITWSLAIEEQYYFFWPLLVLVLDRVRLGVACIVIFASSIALRVLFLHWDTAPFSIYCLTPFRLDSLSVGSLIAIAMRSPMGTLPRLKIASRVLLAVGGVVSLITFYMDAGLPWDGAAVQTYGFAGFALFFGGLVLATVLADGRRTLLDKLMTTRFLSILGLYSYAMYLFHLPLRALLRDTILKPQYFAAFPGGAIVGQLFFYVPALILSVGAAWISYHLFEVRFLKLKQRLAPRSEGAPQAAAPAPSTIGA